MTVNISKEQAFPLSKEGEYGIDASTARLSVGQWPDKVNFGGMVFEKTMRKENDEGEIQFVDYMNGWEILRIFND